MKKIISFVLAAVMALSLVSCGKKEDGGKIVLRVDSWPDKDTAPKDYEMMMDAKARFEEKYPNIVIEPDTWRFSVDSFLPKAAANQLPDILYIPFTEVDKVVDAGYAEDLTEYMNKYKYTDNLDEDILDLVTRDNKIYMIPSSAYALGLMANLDIFKEAGEVNENGVIEFPKTFDELGALAGRIKKKTGKPGFILPTVKNCGGWHFMPIAWAFGTKFMEQENGKWVAKFSSPECEAALQFVKDLKWKYDALPDNMFIDNTEGFKLLASEQGAMWLCDPGTSTLKHCVRTYGMNKDSISVGLLPAGPAGRYTLMGGSLFMIPKGTDPEKIDAAFKWLNFRGLGFEVPDEEWESYRKDLEGYVEDGVPVLDRVLFSVWKSGDKIEKENEIRAEYANVNMDNFREFMEFKDIEIKPEEPVCCQELYALLDNCIQAVIEDKNADVHKLLADAANDFQINYLDNVK